MTTPKAKAVIQSLIGGTVKDLSASMVFTPGSGVVNCPVITVCRGGEDTADQVEMMIPLLCPACDAPIHINTAQLDTIKTLIGEGTLDDAHIVRVANLKGLAKYAEEMQSKTIETTSHHVDREARTRVFPVIHLWFSQIDTGEEFTLFVSPLSFELAGIVDQAEESRQ